MKSDTFAAARKGAHLEGMQCGSNIWAHGCQAYFSSRFEAVFWKGVIKDIVW